MLGIWDCLKKAWPHRNEQNKCAEKKILSVPKIMIVQLFWCQTCFISIAFKRSPQTLLEILIARIRCAQANWKWNANIGKVQGKHLWRRLIIVKFQNRKWALHTLFLSFSESFRTTAIQETAQSRIQNHSQNAPS